MLSHRNIHEQQAHNRRMTRVGVGAFVAFFLLLGLWFDGWTGMLQDELTGVSLFLVPPIIVVFLFSFWSFFQTLHAHVWYRIDPDFDVEETRRRAEIRWTVILVLQYIAFLYFVFVAGQSLSSPHSILFKTIFLGSTFPWGTLLFIAIGILYSYLMYERGDRIIERTIEPQPPNEAVDEEKRFLNVVEETSIAAGMDCLKSGIIEHSEPNAFALGLSPSQSSILVTRGLLRKLTRDELQAVVAHEVAHIRNHDTRLMTIITALYGSVLLLADWSRTDMVVGGILTRRRLPRLRGFGGPVIFIVAFVAMLLAPLLARLLALGISRQREYLADAGAAELTRNPVALVNALTKLQKENNWGSPIFRSVAHLCIVDPQARPIGKRSGMLAEWLSTHPPLEKRIILLNALAYRYAHEPENLQEKEAGVLPRLS